MRPLLGDLSDTRVVSRSRYGLERPMTGTHSPKIRPDRFPRRMILNRTNQGAFPYRQLAERFSELLVDPTPPSRQTEFRMGIAELFGGGKPLHETHIFTGEEAFFLRQESHSSAPSPP